MFFRNPFEFAMEKGVDDVPGTFVDVLTEEENETPLFLAVKHGHVTAVKQLIKAHASLNIANVDGLTPLSIGRWENMRMYSGAK